MVYFKVLSFPNTRMFGYGGTMRRYLDWRIAALIGFAVFLIGGIDQTTLNALKVQHILKKIESHQPRPGSKQLTEQVTQTELNAYITHRLAKEKNPHVKSLKVNLLGNNQVKGKLSSDAQQLNLSLIYGDVLNFDFKGIVHTRDGKGRIDLRTLRLNGQPVSPQMLDLIISTVAQYNGTPPSRIGDWYELPKGIKSILVDKGKAFLYY